MFDDYAKRLEKLGADVPKIFKMVAKKGAIHAENTAKRMTTEEKLVDTGAYRRNWNGESVELDKTTHGITLQNNMEYASHLEWGHKLRNGKHWKGRFVGKKTMNDTEGWAILELRNEIDIAMLEKEHGLTRKEAINVLKSYD